MHGGSGSTREEIGTAVSAGVIKMNVDTATQWAYWDGVRKFEAEKHDYLQGKLGNPAGPDAPNKKNYDPRVWVRKAEESMAERCGESMDILMCKGTYPAKIPVAGSLPLFHFKPADSAVVDAFKSAMNKVGLS